jgi:hypothetical protein
MTPYRHLVPHQAYLVHTLGSKLDGDTMISTWGGGLQGAWIGAGHMHAFCYGCYGWVDELIN